MSDFGAQHAVLEALGLLGVVLIWLFHVEPKTFVAPPLDDE